jgi:superfamily I DNA/RNA helicase
MQRRRRARRLAAVQLAIIPTDPPRRGGARPGTCSLVDEFQDTDPLQCEIALLLCEDPHAPAAARAEPAPRAEEVQLARGKLFLVGDPKQSIYRFPRRRSRHLRAARRGRCSRKAAARSS